MYETLQPSEGVVSDGPVTFFGDAASPVTDDPSSVRKERSSVPWGDKRGGEEGEGEGEASGRGLNADLGSESGENGGTYEAVLGDGDDDEGVCEGEGEYVVLAMVSDVVDDDVEPAQRRACQVRVGPIDRFLSVS
jgi:hypothetical protein